MCLLCSLCAVPELLLTLRQGTASQAPPVPQQMWGVQVSGFCYLGAGAAQQLQRGAGHSFVPLLSRLLWSLEAPTAPSPDIPVVATVVLGLAGKPCCS